MAGGDAGNTTTNPLFAEAGRTNTPVSRRQQTLINRLTTMVGGQFAVMQRLMEQKHAAGG